MENLIINKKRLKLLLTEKKEFIGLWKMPVYFELLSTVAFAVTVATTEYKPMLGIKSTTIQNIGVVVCGLLFFKGSIDMGKCFMKPYDHEKMYNDIKKLDEKLHCFSIVVIKDTFNEPSNKFLLQYVESWKCKLFPFYRTVDDDETHIKQQLANEFGVLESSIALEYKFHKEHIKFSVKDNRDKRYLHKIYYACISDMPNVMRNATFEIQGKHYYWLNFNDMDKDQEIQKYNLDIVNFVKEIVF